MDNVKIKINPEAITKLEELEMDLLRRLAEQVKEEAKALAPVKSGELRDSIDILDEEKESKRINISTQCGYGLYVEMGTSKSPSQPFMRPALDIVEVSGK